MAGFERTGAQDRELTFGERAVGLNFNPSGDPSVAKLKGLFAEIIDIMHEGFEAAPETGPEVYIWREAIMHSIDAQMWTVKAATWRA